MTAFYRWIVESRKIYQSLRMVVFSKLMEGYYSDQSIKRIGIDSGDKNVDQAVTWVVKGRSWVSMYTCAQPAAWPAMCSHLRSVSFVVCSGTKYSIRSCHPLLLRSHIWSWIRGPCVWDLDRKPRRKWLFSRTDLSRRERYPIVQLYIQALSPRSVCQCQSGLSRDPSKFDSVVFQDKVEKFSHLIFPFLVHA